MYLLSVIIVVCSYNAMEFANVVASSRKMKKERVPESRFWSIHGCICKNYKPWKSPT